MKAEPILSENEIKDKTRTKAKAFDDNSGKEVMIDVESNGKLEAFLILKNWYETFNGVKVKGGFFRKMHSLLFFIFIIVSFFALASLPFLSPFYIGALMTYFFGFNLVMVMIIATFLFLFTLPVLAGMSKVVADMFINSKAIDNKIEKIDGGKLEVFGEKLGFSFLNPQVKDMQAIQDFFIWMVNITKNLDCVTDDVYSDEAISGKKEDGTESDENKDESEAMWWQANLAKLKSYDLNSKDELKEIMFKAFLRLPQTVVLIIKNKDYKLVWESVVNGKSGAFIGDLTAGNKERLLQKFANGG